ncbi:MAG: tetratricopeptide repeat protein [Cyanobacteria bacterium P01_F01_bin.150]
MRRISLLALSIATVTALFPMSIVTAESIGNEQESLQIAQNSEPESLLLDVTGSLESGDQQLDDDSFVDVYTFEGQAGQTVTIFLESTAFDAYLLLADAQDNRLARNNDISNDNRNAALIVTLPRDGTYRILANSNASEDQGTYRLKAAPTSPLTTDLAHTNPLLRTLLRPQEIQQLAAEQASQQGSQHYSRAEFQESISALEIALQLYQHLGDRAKEGQIYGNLGVVYTKLGQYDQALMYFQKDLEIAQEMEDRVGEGQTYGNLGNVYIRLSQYDQALTFHQRALDIFEEIGDRVREGQTYGNLGNICHSLGQYDRALDYHQKDLAIAQEIGDQAGEGRAYGNLGNVYISQVKYDQALASHQQALDIFQEIGDPVGIEGANGNLGIVYYKQEKYDDAVTHYQQALKIAQKIGDRAGESLASGNLGIVAYDRGEYDRSIQVWQETIDIYETLRPEALGEVNQLSLLDTQLDVYGYLQDALVIQNQPNLALETAERSRTQVLKLEMLRLLPADQAAPWIGPLSIEEIQQIAMDQAATLISYTVLPNGKVLIWGIQPNGQIYQTFSDLAALPDSVDKVLTPFAISNSARGTQRPDTLLQDLVRGTQSEITATPISDGDLGLDKLYQVLIEPIAHLLPEDETDRVIFIPHRELFQVPFAALQNPETGDYLIEKHTISIAPSILSLALTQERQTQLNGSGSGALIVGNPTLSPELADAYELKPLTWVEAEATTIQSLLKASDDDVLLRDAATEQAVADRIHSARYLHFATHGLVFEKPRYSTITGLLALAPSPEDELGEFTVQDILDLSKDNPFNAELAVLSACRTGDGNITSDGAFGLARAFLVGGVPSLVVSLRDVPDDATKELMTAFYTEMLETGDKAHALRHAMLTTMDEYPDPRAWGAFILIGQP